MTEFAVEPEVSVTFAWTDSEGAPQTLVLPPECPGSAGAWWQTLILPDWEYRYEYAPPSRSVPGNVLLAAVPDSGAVTLQVAVRDTTIAGVEAQKEAIRAALSTWGGTFTVTADPGDGAVSVGGPWQRFPTIPRWGAVTPQRVGLYVAEAAFNVPVNPPGAP